MRVDVGTKNSKAHHRIRMLQTGRSIQKRLVRFIVLCNSFNMILVFGRLNFRTVRTSLRILKICYTIYNGGLEFVRHKTNHHFHSIIILRSKYMHEVKTFIQKLCSMSWIICKRQKIISWSSTCQIRMIMHISCIATLQECTLLFLCK